MHMLTATPVDARVETRIGLVGGTHGDDDLRAGRLVHGGAGVWLTARATRNGSRGETAEQTRHGPASGDHRIGQLQSESLQIEK